MSMSVRVGNIDKEVSEVYCKVDNVWKKVSNMSVNVNGTWRDAGLILKFSLRLVTPLTYEKRYTVGTTINDCALLAGGYGSGGEDGVDIYSPSLVKSTGTSLSKLRARASSSCNANYAMIYCGFNDKPQVTEVYNSIDVYNPSLIRSGPLYTTVRGYDMSSSASANYNMVAGGEDGISGTLSDVVHAFDNSLTRLTPSPLSIPTDALMSASVGGYIIFAGGFDNNPDGSSAVTAYISTLVKTMLSPLTTIKRNGVGSNIGNYALFAGGMSYPDIYTRLPSSVVDVYSSTLVKSTPTVLSEAKYDLESVSLSTHAIFAGGTSSNKDECNTVDAYDPSLVRTILPPLTYGAVDMGAARAGTNALFGGGSTSRTLEDDIVYAYSMY